MLETGILGKADGEGGLLQVNTQLLMALVDILRLQNGPQDLPGTSSALAATIAVSCALSLIALGIMGNDNPALQIAAAAGFTLLFVGVALQLRRLGNRFVQTATALFGTDALLTLIALPATAGLDQAAEEISPIAAVWLLGVLLWTLVVVGHILRNALDLPLIGGVLAALLYLFLSVNVTAMVA